MHGAVFLLHGSQRMLPMGHLWQLLVHKIDIFLVGNNPNVLFVNQTSKAVDGELK